MSALVFAHRHAPWVERLFELVAPSRCSACNAPARPDLPFCPPCERTVEPAPVEVIDGLPAYAPARYSGSVSRAITRLKYEDRPDLSRRLGAWLATLWVTVPLEASLVVPVPLHAQRLAERKYNQSALLGAAFARAAGLVCRPAGLRRIRATEQQAHLTKRERALNVHGAFRARERLSGHSVVVLDDVFTTGATALACAHALQEAGARVVAVLAVARAFAPAASHGSPAPLETDLA